MKSLDRSDLEQYIKKYLSIKENKGTFPHIEHIGGGWYHMGSGLYGGVGAWEDYKELMYEHFLQEPKLINEN